MLIIACGALAREIVEFRAANHFEHLDIACLPANLHNRPQWIAGAVRKKIQANKGKYRSIFIAYGDCGTGGALDKVLVQEGVTRIGGPHCYAFYTGQDAFQEITDKDPTCFFLTDYMVRHFERLIIEGLGLDRFPELLSDYFGNYRNIVYIAQTRNPELELKAQAAAKRLGLAYEYRFVGFGELGDFFTRGRRRQTRKIRLMTRTVLSSATRDVAIGFDEPFCIIGERINPTGRKLLMAEMTAGDYSRVEADGLI